MSDATFFSVPHHMQVNLHGFDEGLVQKLNYGVFYLAHTEAAMRHGQTFTQVQTMCLLLCNVEMSCNGMISLVIV
jgi:hypothetical protein